jgi:hypothetical protein
VQAERINPVEANSGLLLLDTDVVQMTEVQNIVTHMGVDRRGLD